MIARFRIPILLMALAGMVILPGGEAMAAPPIPSGDYSYLAMGGKVYHAFTRNGEVWLETSLDGGLTVAYGTGLGGQNALEGTCRMWELDGRAYVAVKNTAGEVWAKSFHPSEDNNGNGAGWVRLH